MQHARLELHIEHLNLPDLPQPHRVRVVAAIEQELTRLWQEEGVPAGVKAEQPIALDSHTIHVAVGLRPEALGAQIAQSIYSSVNASGQPPEIKGEL